MICYVRPGHIFRKPCLIALRGLAVVGLKSDACRYWDSSGFEVFDRILFTTFYDWCVPRGTSHIPVFLFLFPLIIYSPFFCIDISCFSSVVVHPLSHKIQIILMGLSTFLVKCGSASIPCLDLVAGMLLYVWNPLCFHMVVLLSYHYPYLQGPM